MRAPLNGVFYSARCGLRLQLALALQVVLLVVLAQLRAGPAWRAQRPLATAGLGDPSRSCALLRRPPLQGTTHPVRYIASHVLLFLNHYRHSTPWRVDTPVADHPGMGPRSRVPGRGGRRASSRRPRSAGAVAAENGLSDCEIRAFEPVCRSNTWESDDGTNECGTGSACLD